MRRQENSDLKISINYSSPLLRSGKFPFATRLVPADLLNPPVVLRMDAFPSAISVAKADRKPSAFTLEEICLFHMNHDGLPILKLHYTQTLKAARKHAATALTSRFPDACGEPVDFSDNNGCCESPGGFHAFPLE